MAYDKVVDSTQLETAITATANAIREKTGDTALIEWVANKGFAEAIAAIEAGGELKMVTGSFTPSETINNIKLTHELGGVPKIAAAFMKSDSMSIYQQKNLFIGAVTINGETRRCEVEYVSGGYRLRGYSYSNADITQPSSSKAPFYQATDTSICVGHDPSMASAYFVSGVEYVYIFAM